MTADFNLQRYEARQKELRSLVKDVKIDPEFFKIKTRVNRPKKSKVPQEETVYE